jgi:hypothetical protein
MKAKKTETYFVEYVDVEGQEKVEADDVKPTAKFISFYRKGKLVLFVPVSRISRVAEKDFEAHKSEIQKVDVAAVVGYLASKGIRVPAIEAETNRTVTN